MDISSERFLIDLHRSCKKTMDYLIINKPELAITASHEFDNFILHLKSKIGKINYYLNKDVRVEPKIIKAKSPNFIFEFKINPDKSSQFNVSLLLSASRLFDSGYIINRIKEYTGYVYFIESEFGYKIGCTSNIKKRLKIFEVKLPFKVKLHSYIECKDYNNLESFLHKHLVHKRIDGEWFDLTESDFIEIDKVITNLKLNRIISYE